MNYLSVTICFNRPISTFIICSCFANNDSYTTVIEHDEDDVPDVVDDADTVVKTKLILLIQWLTVI